MTNTQMKKTKYTKLHNNSKYIKLHNIQLFSFFHLRVELIRLSP